ncbi:uncharacterized protein HD556DRAFT_1447260 [Suillus plorans]|uniref:Uncharacterized protein n=1 Tax=Suillus plorans TaxID=116603 RepID=A0A9P7DE37_9AGAM|nr:uncharacterized protein HD556DRAFT_1447260 [Suillus plorans]KAG1789200.1 hypothetical protein HD556DRAFT_1447260 [Suillus plorans]
MFPESLKFDITTLRSLSASASCSPASTHFGSNNNRSDGPFAGIGDLYDVLEAVSSMSVHEPSDSEANLVMDVVRAKHNVFLAQKMLVDCILRENEVFASLIQFQAEAAEKKVDDMDLGLGWMRIIFRKYGWSHLPQNHVLLRRQDQISSFGASDVEIPPSRQPTIVLD